MLRTRVLHVASLAQGGQEVCRVRSSMAGSVLTRDLLAADGRIIASRGEVIDLSLLKDIAARAAADGARERPLHETPVAAGVLEALDAPALSHVVGDDATRAQIADLVSDIRFPPAVWDELEALRREDGLRYQHAIWTAVVAARMFGSALGVAPETNRLVGGALTHDVGMRHAATRLRFKRDHLSESDALALEDHPIVGALILASTLGDAPAVHFALLHHTRPAAGYPRAPGKAPLRALDIVAVASAFSALVAPRSYRKQPYNPRGAIDQLVDEAREGSVDERAVLLLIHCLRGGKGSLGSLKLPSKPTGFRPPANCHGRGACASHA